MKNRLTLGQTGSTPGYSLDMEFMTFFAISHLLFASSTPPTITSGKASCPSAHMIVTQTDEEDRKSSVIIKKKSTENLWEEQVLNY